jgi:hypothetical protein
VEFLLCLISCHGWNKVKARSHQTGLHFTVGFHRQPHGKTQTASPRCAPGRFIRVRAHKVPQPEGEGEVGADGIISSTLLLYYKILPLGQLFFEEKVHIFCITWPPRISVRDVIKSSFVHALRGFSVHIYRITSYWREILLIFIMIDTWRRLSQWREVIRDGHVIFIMVKSEHSEWPILLLIGTSRICPRLLIVSNCCFWISTAAQYHLCIQMPGVYFPFLSLSIYPSVYVRCYLPEINKSISFVNIEILDFVVERGVLCIKTYNVLQ